MIPKKRTEYAPEPEGIFGCLQYTLDRKGKITFIKNVAYWDPSNDKGRDDIAYIPSCAYLEAWYFLKESGRHKESEVLRSKMTLKALLDLSLDVELSCRKIQRGAPFGGYVVFPSADKDLKKKLDEEKLEQDILPFKVSSEGGVKAAKQRAWAAYVYGEYEKLIADTEKKVGNGEMSKSAAELVCTTFKETYDENNVDDDVATGLYC